MYSKLKQVTNLFYKFIVYRVINNYHKDNWTLCKELPYLTYNKSTKKLSLNRDNINLYYLSKYRRTIMTELRKIIPSCYVKIDEIITGYYDQCLERYIYERLNRSYNNENTCWHKYAQNNKCFSWQEPNNVFNKKAKIEFYNEYCKLNPNKNIDKSIINRLHRDENGYIYDISDRIIKKDDKVLSLYNKIIKSKFSNIISSFTGSPIILDYSQITKRYNVTSGRHRIAVLRYLRTQGKINNIKVRCHIVEHPYPSLVFTRPYKETCKQCSWGEIYDPGGEGRHQDYHFREGTVYMRGHPKKKGGRQKWEVIKPIFRNYTQNKTILDVGAHLGLFCLKALENGSSKVTALETDDQHIKNLLRIKKQYYLNDLLVLHGDFFDEIVYEKLCGNNYDTVFLFGIIHHLLRIGIQKQILSSYDELIERIFKIINYGVIIEFAIPREKDFLLPNLKEHESKFSIKEFEMALKDNFANYRNLGKCNYVSGNRSGRFMFCAQK